MRTRVALVVAVTVAGVIGVVVPGGAADNEGHVTEFSAGFTPGMDPSGATAADPSEITAGPDGNLWFGEDGAGRIGQISPKGVIAEFSVGITRSAFSGALVDEAGNPVGTGEEGPFFPGITAGPDGNLWFTAVLPDAVVADVHARVGRITPDGVISEFSAGITQPFPGLSGITAGPDGNLWFTENTVGIGRITPDGVVTAFTAGMTASPNEITAGPDGNLWFTEYAYESEESETATGLIGRITPDGVVTEFSAGIKGGDREQITAGPDGNIWFTDNGGRQIERITPKGKVTKLSTGGIERVSDITTGCDGNLWFAGSDLAVEVGAIGRITPKGKVTVFPVDLAAATPNRITAGPDGNLWFTETGGTDRIGRIGSGASKSSRPGRRAKLPAACRRARH